MLLIPENVSHFSSSHDNCIKLSGCETEGYQFYLCIQLEEVTIYNICAFLIRHTHWDLQSTQWGVYYSSFRQAQLHVKSRQMPDNLSCLKTDL